MSSPSPARPWSPWTTAAHAAMATAMLVLALRHQDYLFKGEDWIEAVTGVLTRFGHFEGALSFRKGFRLQNFFTSSYGPAYYLYDSLRVLLFRLHALPFTEVTFRYVTSISAVVLVAGSAVMLRPRMGRLQILTYLLLVGTSPVYVFYYRNYCVYPLMMLFESAAAVALLAYLSDGRLSRLAAFYASMFCALTTLATCVNDLLACLLFACVLPRVRGWDRELVAVAREGLRRLFLGSWARRALGLAFVAAVGGVIWYDWSHFPQLMGSSGLYQGTFAKSFQKAMAGQADPVSNAAILVREVLSSLGPDSAVLAVLAAANVAISRRLSHLSLIFGFSFCAALAECLFVVPTAQLGYAWRSIPYTFPLLVVIADNAGELLARIRLGRVAWAGCALLALVDRDVRPIEDVRSILAPETPVGAYKALGYVYRTDGLDEAARSCTALDVPMDGPRLFYLNRVRPNALAATGAPFRLCAAVVSKPPSGRLERAIRNSGLVHRRSVTEGGHPVLEIYLDDRMAALWRHPTALDAGEYSRRFTREFHTLERLFGSRWARVATTDTHEGFY